MKTDALSSYLARHPWHHEAVERWPIQGDLRVRLSIARELPPPAFISSILAIVVNSRSQVLYLWPTEPSGSISHVLIGGRSRQGELPEATVIREVGEETGWRVAPGRMIGFRHFIHLGARPAQSDRPYPEFVQPIYAALALQRDRSLLVPMDHVPAEFFDLEATELKTEPAQRPLLHAAVCDTMSAAKNA